MQTESKSDLVPSELLLSGGKEAWKLVVIKDTDPVSNGFAVKLNQLLKDEGKSMMGVQILLSSFFRTSQDSVICAVGELLEKTRHSNEGTAYRHLRCFSGIFSTQAGEENIKNWLEKDELMVTECDCTKKKKQKHIVESLKGPELEIVKALRLSSNDASAGKYLETLKSAFGTSESGEDLYFAFQL